MTERVYGMRMSSLDYRIPTPCTLSMYSMEMIAPHLGPSFTYDLYVHALQFIEASKLAKNIGAATVDHPFAPHINVHIDLELEVGNWYVGANGKRAGSEGF